MNRGKKTQLQKSLLKNVQGFPLLVWQGNVQGMYGNLLPKNIHIYLNLYIHIEFW